MRRPGQVGCAGVGRHIDRFKPPRGLSLDRDGTDSLYRISRGSDLSLPSIVNYCETVSHGFITTTQIKETRYEIAQNPFNAHPHRSLRSLQFGRVRSKQRGCSTQETD